MELDPVRVAWAAGFLDGEGSFMCFSARQPRKKDGWAWRHWLVVAAAQSGSQPGVIPDELLELKELFGGSVRQKGRSSKHYKPAWTWQVATKQARDTALQVSPYLHQAKRQQLNEALARVADRRALGRTWPGATARSDQESS